MFEAIAREVRFAARNLTRRTGFSITVILTLAVGIAGATVVFSLVSGALLRPPPFHRPERLALIYRTAANGAKSPRLTRWSYPRFVELRRTVRSFAAVATFGRTDLNMVVGGEPERVPAELVSADYFSVLRAAPALGRLPRADEDATSGVGPVAVIGHQLWVRRFGANQTAIGKVIRVNGEPLTVIGVMPPRFTGLTGQADMWVPKSMAPALTYSEYLTTDQNFISVIGRLADGATWESAEAELGVLGSRIAAALPDTDDAADRWGAAAVLLSNARIDPGSRQALRFLLAAVGCFLLLACTNVAGLGLAEVVSRRQEITVRLALGAGRLRVIGQLLAESALLGAAAGGLGLLLAGFLISVVRIPASIPGPGNMWGSVGNFAAVEIDWRVMAFSLLASVAAVLVSGLIPALSAGRTDLAVELKDRTASLGGGRRPKAQASLVVLEVALALILAVGGGLLFESLRRLESTPLGIAPESVLTFQIEPSDVRYPTERAPLLLDRVLAAVRAVPGVRAATVDGCAPLSLRCASSSLFIEGRAWTDDEAPPISRHYVGPEHFATLGIPLLAGRAFTDQDRDGRPGVAIINETAARRYFTDRDPIGQRIWFGGGSRWHSLDSAATIVGVVGDVPYGSLDRAQVASVYTPYRQFSYAFRTIMVKVDGEPSRYQHAIQAAVASVDQLPAFEIRPLTDRLGDAWARTAFVARLMGVFALVALGLAAGGVYGIVSHSVNRRTRELGIRAALGANRADLLRLLVGEGLRLAVLGIGLGVVAALGLGRLVGSLLYGVGAADPVVFGVLSLALATAAALASYFPARRAARVDPVKSLRVD